MNKDIHMSSECPVFKTVMLLWLAMKFVSSRHNFRIMHRYLLQWIESSHPIVQITIACGILDYLMKCKLCFKLAQMEYGPITLLV
jgi:hypothetical protein